MFNEQSSAPGQRTGGTQEEVFNASQYTPSGYGNVPHSTELEADVLSSVMYGVADPASLNLTGRDFYSPDHEALWDVIVGMGSHDPVLVREACHDDRLKALVVELAGRQMAAMTADVLAPEYAQKLRDLTARRDLQTSLTKALQEASQPDADPGAIMADLAAHSQAPAHRGNRRGRITGMGEVKAERHEWVKKDWYPCDVVTVLAGHGGEGKSTFSLADAAAGSRGELHGRCWGRPVRTLIVATEDTLSDQKLRLRAAGAVEDHLGFFTVERNDGDAVAFKITADLAELERAAVEFKADLLIIDPLSSVVEGDLNKTDVMRSAIDPLSALARKLHVAVLVVHHFNKGSGNASRKMTGSEALRDAVRSAIFFAHDKETDERVLSFDKASYSQYEGRNFNFTLDSAPAIDDDGKEMFDEEGNSETVPVVNILGETETSVQKIINTVPQGQEDDDRNEAQAFLLGYLADNGGEVPASDVLKAGHAAGFSDNELKNGRKRCRDPRIASRKSGMGSGWVWAIDEESSHEGVTKVSKVSGPRRVTPSTPSVTPSAEPEPPTLPEEPSRPLSVVPDDPCGFCGKSLAQTPGQRVCGANHRRAQEAAS